MSQGIATSWATMMRLKGSRQQGLTTPEPHFQFQVTGFFCADLMGPTCEIELGDSRFVAQAESCEGVAQSLPAHGQPPACFVSGFHRAGELAPVVYLPLGHLPWHTAKAWKGHPLWATWHTKSQL